MPFPPERAGAIDSISGGTITIAGDSTFANNSAFGILSSGGEFHDPHSACVRTGPFMLEETRLRQHDAAVVCVSPSRKVCTAN